MSTPFQNRLVGTIIVAAVAIIFLPDVLDGDKKTYQDNFETIPTAPQVEFPNADKVFPKENLAKLAKDKISDEMAVDDTSSIDTSKLLAEKGVAVTTLAKETDFSAASNDKIVAKVTNKKIKTVPNSVPFDAIRYLT